MRKLTIIRILNYYDVPQLFVAEDVFGASYICLLYDENDSGDGMYLGVTVSKTKLNDFIKGHIDLLSIYRCPEVTDALFKVTYGDEGLVAVPLQTDPDESMLPGEGFYFDDSFNDDDKMLELANSIRHPVIRLAFNSPQNRHDMDVLCLSATLAQFQSLMNSSYRKLYRKEPTDAKLRMFATTAASFDIELVADEELDLFGESRIGKILEMINGLFTSDTDTVIESLRSIKGFAVSSFKKFIDVLYENELTLNMKWVYSTRDTDIRHGVLEEGNIRALHETINKHSELELEEASFEGSFIAASTQNGKWTFHPVVGKEIKGDSGNPTLLEGITLSGKIYRIICSTQQIKNDTTLKEQVKYQLIEINALN